MTSGYAIMSWLLVEQSLTQRNRIRTGKRSRLRGPAMYLARGMAR
jgi:hypothetical protein